MKMDDTTARARALDAAVTLVRDLGITDAYADAGRCDTVLRLTVNLADELAGWIKTGEFDLPHNLPYRPGQNA